MEIIGSQINRLTEVDSTNNYAASCLLTNSLTEGTVIIADRQIDGRGQVSNKWESEPDKNLTFTIILYPGFLEISKQFEISKTISLGVADFLMTKTSEISIKWPNDVFAGNKKIAGILIENTIQGNSISGCIVGIGLNINQKEFKSEALNPVSLTQITGQEYDLNEMLSELCSSLDKRYSQLSSGMLDAIDANYLSSLYKYGQTALYADLHGDFLGRITGVDPIGRLIIEDESGNYRKFHHKEVVFK